MDGCSGTNRGSGIEGIGLEQSERADAKIESPPLLLSSPEIPYTGNVVTDLLIFFENTLGKQRQQAAERRDQADAAQDRAETKQVEQMRREARETFKQAIVSGAISLTAGAAQCVGAGVGLRGAECERWAALNPDGGAAQIQSAYGKTYAATQRAFDAGATVLSGASKATDGLHGAAIKSIQADATEAEHEARQAGRDAQRETELEREIDEMQNKALDRLESLLQAEHQSRIAVIQARA